MVMDVTVVHLIVVAMVNVITIYNLGVYVCS